MALREKLHDRMQPALEPGEQIQQVFMAQTGPNPNWLFLSYLFLFWSKYYVIAVTDRGIIRAQAGMWVPSKPKLEPGAVMRYAPQPFGDVGGFLYDDFQLGGETHYSHRRFWNDIKASNAIMQAAAPPQYAPADSQTMPPPPPAS